MSGVLVEDTTWRDIRDENINENTFWYYILSTSSPRLQYDDSEIKNPSLHRMPFYGRLSAMRDYVLVPPCGIEPQPSEPESEILSIKLRRHNPFQRAGTTGCPGRGIANIANFSEYFDFFVFLSGYTPALYRLKWLKAVLLASDFIQTQRRIAGCGGI